MLSVLFKKHATIQTYPAYYRKNCNLVTTDSSCLQSCQSFYTVIDLYNWEFLVPELVVLLCAVLFLTYLYPSSNEVSKPEYSILDAV